MYIKVVKDQLIFFCGFSNWRMVKETVNGSVLLGKTQREKIKLTRIKLTKTLVLVNLCTN